MLAIETYIQSSVSSLSNKACAVARWIAFASIATSIEIDALQASGKGVGPAGAVVSGSDLLEDEGQAKQLDYWQQYSS